MVRSKSILEHPARPHEELEVAFAMLQRLSRWRDDVVTAAHGLGQEACGCRQDYVSRVKRLAAIIEQAPGEP